MDAFNRMLSDLLAKIDLAKQDETEWPPVTTSDHPMVTNKPLISKAVATVAKVATWKAGGEEKIDDPERMGMAIDLAEGRARKDTFSGGYFGYCGHSLSDQGVSSGHRVATGRNSGGSFVESQPLNSGHLNETRWPPEAVSDQTTAYPASDTGSRDGEVAVATVATPSNAVASEAIVATEPPVATMATSNLDRDLATWWSAVSPDRWPSYQEVACRWLSRGADR